VDSRQSLKTRELRRLTGMINILPKWIDAESATPFFFIDRKDSKIYSDVGGCVSSQRKLFWFCFRCFSKNERTLLILSAHAWRSPPVVAPLYGHGSAGVQSSPMRISNGTKRLIKSDIANDRRARSQRCELSASRHIEQHKGDRAQRPQQIYPSGHGRKIYSLVRNVGLFSPHIGQRLLDLTK